MNVMIKKKFMFFLYIGVVLAANEAQTFAEEGKEAVVKILERRPSAVDPEARKEAKRCHQVLPRPCDSSNAACQEAINRCDKIETCQAHLESGIGGDAFYYSCLSQGEVLCRHRKLNCEHGLPSLP